MKKKISAFVASIGGRTNYSGNDRIMYITDPAPKATKRAYGKTMRQLVIAAFDNVSFKMKYVNVADGKVEFTGWS